MTFDGFPLGYEVFAGNTHDSKTLQTIVATMEARHGVLGRVWIADRGMASAENLAWLRETGRRYGIGAPKSELKKFGSEFSLARMAGAWCKKASRSNSRAIPRPTRSLSFAAPTTDAAKSERCTTSSAGGSSRRSNACPLASRAQRNRLIRRR